MLTSVPEEIRIFGVVQASTSLVRISKGSSEQSNRMKQNLPPLVFVLALMLLPGAFATPPNATANQSINSTGNIPDFYIEPNEFVILKNTPKTLDMYVRFSGPESSYILEHKIKSNLTDDVPDESWIYYPTKIARDTWENKRIPIIVKIPDKWGFGEYIVTFGLYDHKELKHETQILIKVRSESALMMLDEGEIEGGVLNSAFRFFILATVAAIAMVIYISYKRYV